MIESESVVAPRDTRAREAIRAQATFTALGGAGAFIVASAIFAVAVAGDGWWWNAVSSVVSPYLFGWLVTVAGLAWVLRRRSSRAFGASAVVAAPVVTLLVEFVISGGMVGNLVPVLILQGVGLSCAAIVGAVFGVIYRGNRPQSTKSESIAEIVWPDAPQAMDAWTGRLGRAKIARSVPQPSRELALVSIFLVVVGGALALALPLQWLDVYFAIWSAPPAATAAEEARFFWTAGGTLASLSAAFVVASLSGTRGVKWLTGIAAVCALLIAIVFHVQAPRPDSLEAPPGVDEVNPPCYGTSGYCPGG